MPSPFPGMDPYIEAAGLWPDFHATFIGACRELVLRALPPEYDARIDERTTLLDLGVGDLVPPKAAVPDVAIERDPNRGRSAVSGPGGVATLEPATLPVPVLAEVPERYVEIRRAANRELVTVIEVLSPANKANPDYGDHQKKRAGLVYAGVNVVEIDLLTRGLRTEVAAPLPPGDYYTLVFRAAQRHLVQAYAWGVRDPLPAVRVPLRAPDPDVHLDLGSAFATAYERGSYWRSVRYDQPPPVRLPGVDPEWARATAARTTQG